MISMMISFLNVFLYSIAVLNAYSTSRGSSALTWMMGQSAVLPKFVEYNPWRLSAGLVVKPTWLLTTTWMDPPVVKSDRSLICISS